MCRQGPGWENCQTETWLRTPGYFKADVSQFQSGKGEPQSTDYRVRERQREDLNTTESGNKLERGTPWARCISVPVQTVTVRPPFSMGAENHRYDLRSFLLLLIKIKLDKLMDSRNLHPPPQMNYNTLHFSMKSSLKSRQ